MSGTYPATPYPNRIEVKSIQPTLVSVSHSLAVQRRSRDVQRWGFTLVYPPHRRGDVRELWAFLQAQRGRVETFTYSLPVYFNTGPWGGTPTVTTGSQTGRVVETSGWTPSTTPVKAGDFIKFAGQAKVYMATADMAADVSGGGELHIEPPLVESPGAGAAVTGHTSAVPLTWTVTRASDDLNLIFQPASVIEGFTVELVEVI